MLIYLRPILLELKVAKLNVKKKKKKHMDQNQQEMKVMKPSKVVTVSATVPVFHLYIEIPNWWHQAYFINILILKLEIYDSLPLSLS